MEQAASLNLQVIHVNVSQPAESPQGPFPQRAWCIEKGPGGVFHSVKKSPNKPPRKVVYIEEGDNWRVLDRDHSWIVINEGKNSSPTTMFIGDYAITTETGRVELVAIRNITKNQELLNTMSAVIENQGKIRRNCRVMLHRSTMYRVPTNSLPYSLGTLDLSMHLGIVLGPAICEHLISSPWAILWSPRVTIQVRRNWQSMTRSFLGSSSSLGIDGFTSSI